MCPQSKIRESVFNTSSALGHNSSVRKVTAENYVYRDFWTFSAKNIGFLGTLSQYERL
jgi:hypothetical protein